MIGEKVYERAGSGLRALQRADDWLSAHGWSASSRSDGEFHFVNLRGPMRLAVTLLNGGRVRFTFAPGGLGVTLPPDTELEQWVTLCTGEGPVPAPRVGEPSGPDAKTIIDAPSRRAGPGERCSICAAEIPVGASACLLCGIPVS